MEEVGAPPAEGATKLQLKPSKHYSNTSARSLEGEALGAEGKSVKGKVRLKWRSEALE